MRGAGGSMALSRDKKKDHHVPKSVQNISSSPGSAVKVESGDGSSGGGGGVRDLSRAGLRSLVHSTASLFVIRMSSPVIDRPGLREQLEF